MQILVNARHESQCLEALVFTPTVKTVLVRYMDGVVLVILNLLEISKTLTRLVVQHAQSITTYQRVLG